MSLKTKSLIVLLVISIFMLSSCEVYQTLYGKDASSSSEETPTDSEEPVDTQETPAEETPIDSEEPADAQETPAEETPIDSKEPSMQDSSKKVTLCTDGLDNDNDGLFDEEDPGCPKSAPKEESKADETPINTVPTDDNPFVVSVEETDLVNLAPRADDPDKDSISFTFTSPLDDAGSWQTTYGDNGEYTVTVTASDGELTTTRDVLVIVQKKEESPSIGSSKPVESALSIEETDSIDFSVEANDLNNDPLEYEWKLDGVPVSYDSYFEFQSTYDDAGTHTVKVDINDGTTSASRIWSVDVENVNRLPQMSMLDDVHVRETDLITIVVEAYDEDNDAIEYSISDSRFDQDDNVFTWETDYSSAGTYEVTVKASDGQDTTEQTITVVVDNVNRPPMITDIGQK